jgi:hypothetical protein
MRGTQFAQLTAFVDVTEDCRFTRAHPVAAKSSTDGIVSDDTPPHSIHLATPDSSPPRRTGLAISGRPFPPGAGRSRLIPLPQIANTDQRSAVAAL